MHTSIMTISETAICDNNIFINIDRIKESTNVISACTLKEWPTRAVSSGSVP